MHTIYQFLFTLFLLAATDANAIVLVAAELPPYVIRSEQGNPSGIAIDIMEEAARRLGEPITVELMPLARALTEVTERKDMMLVPPVRSAEREQTFYWVAPIMEEEFVIVSNRRFHPEPIRAEQLANLITGTLRHSYSQNLHKQIAHKPSHTVATEVLNAKKLQRGRIDAWISAWNVILYNQRQAGFLPNQLVRGETLKHSQLFVAANRELPVAEGRRWQTVLADMRRDGTLARIARKYGYQAPAHN